MSRTTTRFLAACLLGAAMLPGCSSTSTVTAARGDCEFMMPTERERCLRANAANAEALRTRNAERRNAEQPFVMPTDMKRRESEDGPEKP
jgi:hypothetical protein